MDTVMKAYKLGATVLAEPGCWEVRLSDDRALFTEQATGIHFTVLRNKDEANRRIGISQTTVAGRGKLRFLNGCSLVLVDGKRFAFEDARDLEQLRAWLPPLPAGQRNDATFDPWLAFKFWGFVLLLVAVKVIWEVDTLTLFVIGFAISFVYLVLKSIFFGEPRSQR